MVHLRIELNKIILILSLFDCTPSQVAFYCNLVNHIKKVYEYKIDILLTLNNGAEYEETVEFKDYGNCYTFGTSLNIKPILDIYSSIPRDTTIITPNRGWDVGQFLIGLKYIKNQYEYVYHIHSKSCKKWMDKLLSIKDFNILKLNVDTVVSREKLVWIHEDLVSSIDEDRNLQILKTHSHLFPHESLKTWKYNSGKIFVSRCEFFNILLNNFAEIYNLLTDINKNDTFWCKHMDDKKYYDLEFDRLENCPWNLPMTPLAHEMRKKYNARNYFELLKHGYRGIPDLQIEHAIERYIGYLICHNKDIYAV